MSEKIRWQCVNEKPFEYAIQQGPHGDEFVKLIDGTCLRRASSPVQEPVTTEPVAWQWWTKIGLINMTSSRSEAESWRTKGADVRPLYAIPAPPQPGREEIEMAIRDNAWVDTDETIAGVTDAANAILDLLGGLK